MSEFEKPQSVSPETQAGLDKAQKFIDDVAPHLGRMFGMDLAIRSGSGWATSLETGEVTVDPKFFIEKGYTPDMSAYATLHEVVAHLREIVQAPNHNRRVISFVKKGKAEAIFHNIFSDLAGNRTIHAALPRMERVADTLYKDKLFPESDLTESPRHLQFLYKVIRDKMVKGESATVFPEVEEAIENLTNYQGMGDIIDYSTASASSRTSVLQPAERFHIWREVIYPVYLDLLEQDKNDPEMQKGEGQGEGEPDFSEDYSNYEQNIHPEPMDDTQKEEVRKNASTKQRGKSEAKQKADARKRLDDQLREETGAGVAEHRRYNNEIERWRGSIEDMREIYRKVIEERIHLKRRLSRRNYDAGALLDSNRLVQTIIEVASGVEPMAYKDYKEQPKPNELVGKTDYVFVADVSGSMQGEKAKAAASSLVILLEGLAAMQRDIEAAEAEHSVDLDLDIRTGVLTFDSDIQWNKKLGNQLTDRDRMGSYGAVANPRGGGTDDAGALDQLLALSPEPGRKRYAIILTDGEGNAPGLVPPKVAKLRANGWRVFGIGLGSDAATNVYRPDAKRVDDPNNLPPTMKEFIESTLG